MTSRGTRAIRRALAFVGVGAVLLGALAACGDDPPDAAAAPTPVVIEGSAVDCELTFVPAAEVVAVGDLLPDEQEMVGWALGRFAAADMQLPAIVEFGFDATRARCEGAQGLCLSVDEPPKAIVCEPAGETMYRVLNRRITLLHELAHLWHAGGFAPEAQAIVGGVANGADVAWQMRTNERVATVVSWGLLDQPRRPVESDLACVELYVQFQELTGQAPLGPLEPICIPDPAS